MAERRGEGESVATMWGRMLHEVQSGEVIAIENKHGDEVAVMMSKTEYDRLVERATSPEKVGD